jgi:uncharacterized protein (DUF2235 family)
MGKNIILLSDGTGNSAAKVWRTNVWRTFEALDLHDAQQVAVYDDGVGTSSFKPLALVGGALGWGLKRNVLDLYRFLCRNYEPDAQIFGFGFSRGAFTIRVLIGLVINQGLVRAESESERHRLAAEAYRAYRRERYHSFLRVEFVFRIIRDAAMRAIDRLRGRIPYDKVRNLEAPPIRFLGLWDTVAAYGLPIEEMTRGVSFWLWPLSLPDRKLNDKVQRACHALALDDERTTFHPVLWSERQERPPRPREDSKTYTADERLSQVWFAGTHANVGGGYADDTLAHVPLVWIMDEARACGLRFKAAPAADPDAYKRARSSADKDGRLYDSRKGVAGYYRYGPRKIFELCHMRFSNVPDDEVTIERPKIHESATNRMIAGAHAYAPIGFPAEYAVLSTGGEISAPSYETPTESRARAQAQERVWNLVWKRRVAYFATLAASLHMLLFPLLHATDRTAEFSTPLSWISQLIRLIGGFLPGFVKWWLDAFAANPGLFALGTLAIVGLMMWGVSLGNRIHDQMRSIWSGILQGRPPMGRLPRDWIYRLRTHPFYQRTIWVMKRYVLPTVSAALLLYLGLALLNQVAFNIADAAGAFCREGTKPTRTVLHGEPVSAETAFETSSFCWPSGIVLENGARYRITLQQLAPWRDGSIGTDVNGFEIGELPSWRTRIAMFMALPLRRVLGTPFFRPIARIGARGNDEYSLDPDAQGAPQRPKEDELAATLRARRSGELFLYVNDAVIGIPGIGYPFYRNNRGQALVTVERLGRRDTPARPTRAQ